MITCGSNNNVCAVKAMNKVLHFRSKISHILQPFSTILEPLPAQRPSRNSDRQLVIFLGALISLVRETDDFSIHVCVLRTPKTKVSGITYIGVLSVAL